MERRFMIISETKTWAWLPAVLIWMSLFFILLGNASHEFQQFVLQYRLLFGGFNILALVAGVYQFLQIFRQRTHRFPFGIYTIGLI